jgi:hypothetical protein
MIELFLGLTCLPGGLAFEVFFFLQAPSTVVSKFRTLEYRASVSGGKLEDLVEYASFINDYILQPGLFARYIGFVIKGAHDANIRAGRILQTVTHVAVKCGLSLSGVEILSQLGFASPLSSFKTDAASAIAAHEAYVASSTEAPNITSIWVDNFSRYQMFQ